MSDALLMPPSLSDSGEDFMALFLSTIRNVDVQEGPQSSLDCSSHNKAFEAAAPLDHSKITCFNKYLEAWVSFYKVCEQFTRSENVCCANFGYIQQFRRLVAQFGPLSQRLLLLQKQLVEKYPEFPQVTFNPPEVRVDKTVICPSGCFEEVSGIKTKLKECRNVAQKKVDSQDMNVSAEVDEVAAMWPKHKGLATTCRKNVEEVCAQVAGVLEELGSQAEIICRLYKYIQVLESALESKDPTIVYPRLKSLTNGTYLTVQEKSKTILDKVNELDFSACGNDKDTYIAVLKQEVQTLKEAIQQLIQEKEVLEKEKEAVTEKSLSLIQSQNAVIDQLRAQLKSHGIPDPTRTGDDSK